jgi:hypothetical protein
MAGSVAIKEMKAHESSIEESSQPERKNRNQ